MPTVVEKPNPYETLFIVPPETGQEKIDEFIEKFKATVAKEGGELKSVQVWGRRRLAYPIKRHKDGLYVYVDFDVQASALGPIQTLFNLSDLVIRHLTVDREEAPPPRIRKPKPGTESAEAPAPAENQSEEPSK